MDGMTMSKAKRKRDAVIPFVTASVKKGTEEKDGKEGKRVNETKWERAEEGKCMRSYEMLHQEIGKGVERKKKVNLGKCMQIQNQSVGKKRSQLEYGEG